jgi:hypothetical protein
MKSSYVGSSTDIKKRNQNSKYYNTSCKEYNATLGYSFISAKGENYVFFCAVTILSDDFRSTSPII